MSGIGQLCRVCLRRCKNRRVALQDICIETQKEHEKQVITYLVAYKICTQLQVLLGEDGLPDGLCVGCSKSLQSSYKLWRKARETAAKLQRQLGGTVKTVSSQDVDTNEVTTCLETDFELTASINVTDVAQTKDPLEETETEDELKLEEPDDSEDDKPLKDLLISKNKLDSPQDAIKAENAGAGDINDSPEQTMDNELYGDDDNNSDENAGDMMSATEAQIFPKGRHKCKICEKPYFTHVGLKAHLEVHLPKSAAVKKKRPRCANKNRRKTQSIDEAKSSAAEFEHVEEPTTSCIEQTINTTQHDNEAIVMENADNNDRNAAKLRKLKVPKPKKMFPCHVCGKHMISASKLRYHMVMHTGEKDYLCTMCPKAYSTIYALKHHIRTHTGERPYECKFCGDKFLRPTTLKSHQRRHTGERPYGCDICGKRFIQHSSMTTHMKLNHMDKTIQCPHCDKKYARQTDLNTHLLSHTGDKPYSCQLCPSRFIRQANLNKHMNQHHIGKPGASAEAKAIKTKKATTKVATQELEVDAKKQLETVSTNVGSSVALNILSSHMKLSTENVVNESPQAALLSEPLLNANFTAQPYLCTESSELLLDLPHVKNTQPSIMQSAGHSMQQQSLQHIQSDNSRTMEELARWNWPNHT